MASRKRKPSRKPAAPSQQPPSVAKSKQDSVDPPTTTGEGSDPSVPAPVINQIDGCVPTDQQSSPTHPPQFVVAGLSVLVVAHLLGLVLSYSAIVEPSATHTRLLEALSPYLRPTHFAADGRPLYMTHGTADERPHRLQFAILGDSHQSIDSVADWTTIEPKGMAGLAYSDRYARWVSLVATLAESDQPSMAANLLLPLVSSDQSIDLVRIIRMQTELTTEFEPDVTYIARIVRNGDRTQLIAVESQRLTTSNRTAKGSNRATTGDATVESPDQ